MVFGEKRGWAWGMAPGAAWRHNSRDSQKTLYWRTVWRNKKFFSARRGPFFSRALCGPVCAGPPGGWSLARHPPRFSRLSRLSQLSKYIFNGGLFGKIKNFFFGAPRANFFFRRFLWPGVCKPPWRGAFFRWRLRFALARAGAGDGLKRQRGAALRPPFWRRRRGGKLEKRLRNVRAPLTLPPRRGPRPKRASSRPRGEKFRRGKGLRAAGKKWALRPPRGGGGGQN